MGGIFLLFLWNKNPGGGGTLGISVWGCAASILESLAYTRANSAEFGFSIVE